MMYWVAVSESSGACSSGLSCVDQAIQNVCTDRLTVRTYRNNLV